MIAFLNGITAEVTPELAVIDVNGVGYNVNISPGTADRMPSVGEPVKLYTAFSVREDAMALYGFLSKEELLTYRQLISVSGVGPKAGLAILSTLTVDDLRFAILTADSKAIAKAPGIGKKTAERILLELHDKISGADILPATGDVAQFTGPSSAKERTARDEAIEALMALGYAQSAAMGAVRAAAASLPEDADVETLLAGALREF